MSQGSVGSTGGNLNNRRGQLVRSHSITSAPRPMQPPFNKGRFTSAFNIMLVGLVMLVIGSISATAMKPFLTGNVQSKQAMQVANASLAMNLQKNGLRGKNSPLVAANAVNLRLPVVTPVPFGTRVNAPNFLNPSDPQNALVAASGAKNNFNWSPNLVKAIVQQKTTPDFQQMMKRERGLMIQYCEFDKKCVDSYVADLQKVITAATEGANMNIAFIKDARERQEILNGMARRNIQKTGEKAIAPYMEPIIGALRSLARGAGEIVGEVPVGAAWALVTGVINTSVQYVTSQNKITQGILMIITLVVANFAVKNVTAFFEAMATLANAGRMSAKSAKAVASFLTACVSGLLRKAQAARQPGGDRAAEAAANLEVNEAVNEVIAAVAADAEQ